MVSSPIVYLDQGLTIAGSGYKSFETVEVYFQLGHVQPSLGTAQADPGGAWTLQVGTLKDIRAVKIQTVNLTGQPVVTLEAAGSEGSKASTPVMAMAEKPPTVVTPAPPVGASLVAGTVEKGTTITFWGAGYQPNESIFFMVITGESSGVPVRTVLRAGKAAATGAVTLDLTINLDPGLYTLEGIGAQGSLATAPLIVVAEK
jgi:hypothetical protein